ncbi:MAG: heparinase II/III-family protein, partial [Myxococcota bacterium]
PVTPAPITFPDGGLTVLRTPEVHLVFDHGPLGGFALAAHGHADALATYLHDRFGPVLVGRGTGVYVGAPDFRRFHRGTSAHPTLVLDGADQSAPSDHPFLWRTRATATLDHARPEEGFASAHHDGYAGRGVVHRRAVRVEGPRFTWVDTVDGAGLHHVAVTLPLAPGLTLDADRAVWDGARRVGRIALDPRLRWEVITGGERPGPGWHASAYGEWSPATTVCASAVLRAPATLEGRIELG